MKNIKAYLIIDRLSEGIINVFYSPNDKLATKQFNQFIEQVKKQSGDDSIADDFCLFASSDYVAIPETLQELDNSNYELLGVKENEVVSDL